MTVETTITLNKIEIEEIIRRHFDNLKQPIDGPIHFTFGTSPNDESRFPSPVLTGAKFKQTNTPL